MIDRDELELFTEPYFIRAVEANLDRDPLDIAMDKSLEYARQVATRIKYLRKARTKLPSYYQARCIIPGRAYEQSSGEGSAFSKKYKGGLCIDLTCGLGVDSFAFSRSFDRVIAVEPDTVLARITRYNFTLLGASNVEVVESTAEEFIASYKGPLPDLIYVDPDRRDSSGRRMSALEDCSPDITAMLTVLRELSGRLVLKLSPLFDVAEAFRVFGPGTRVTAVSDRGECKEVLVETGDMVEGPAVLARILGGGEYEFDFETNHIRPSAEERPPIDSFRYLAVPDVAFVKTGTAVRYYEERGWYMPSPAGYAFGNGPDMPEGKIFSVNSIHPYSPKPLRNLFKAGGLQRLNIMARDFPESTASICSQLGVKEGGGSWAAFTLIGGDRYCILLDPLQKGEALPG